MSRGRRRVAPAEQTGGVAPLDARPREPRVPKWRSQQTAGWRPVLRHRALFVVFGVVGAISLAVSIATFVTFIQLHQVTVDYTDATQSFSTDSGTGCAELLASDRDYTDNTKCSSLLPPPRRAVLTSRAPRPATRCQAVVSFEVDNLDGAPLTDHSRSVSLNSALASSPAGA